MKKTLLISLIAGLFLAFTACGKKDDGEGGKVTDETDTDKPSFVVTNELKAVVTVKSECGSTVVHNKGEASKGRCVAVLEEQAPIEISIQWLLKGTEPVVLCGSGEGVEACKLKNQLVDIADNPVLDDEGNPETNEDGSPKTQKGPVLADSPHNGCAIIHCQKEEGEETEEEETEEEETEEEETT